MSSATVTRRFLATQSQGTPKRDSLLLMPAQVADLSPATTRILDVTWFMPNSPRNARDEFNQLRVAGAKYMDLDEVASEHPLGLKHMMPSPQQFKDACENLGITKDHSVVLYDTHSIFSAPRALFMFKAFGHPKAFVMNGGLPAWRDEGLPVETQALSEVGTADIGGDSVSQERKEEYSVMQMAPGVIRSFNDMLENTSKDPKNAELVLDARPTARFTGSAPEPRPGLASGHMRHGVSIPFNALLATHEMARPGIQGTYTTLLGRNELRKAMVDLLDKSGRNGEEVVDLILQGRQTVVASCGSGMTAAVIWLALQELGINQTVALYDEYSTSKGLPFRFGAGRTKGEWLSAAEGSHVAIIAIDEAKAVRANGDGGWRILSLSFMDWVGDAKWTDLNRRYIGALGSTTPDYRRELDWTSPNLEVGVDRQSIHRAGSGYK